MAGCRVAVGTSNEMKVRSVAQAFRVLCSPVEAVPVPVSVEWEQPIGIHQLAYGALTRAVQALEKAGADYGVGVEAGPVPVDPLPPIEVQVAAVVDAEGRVSIGVSQGFMLPSGWASRVLEGTPLGRVAEEATGRKGIGRTHGVIAYLTYGLTSRGDLTRDAVLMALVPRLNPSLYTLPRAADLLARLRQRVKPTRPGNP